jgi:Cdc6-like AAA superfamily ATPase
LNRRAQLARLSSRVSNTISHFGLASSNKCVVQNDVTKINVKLQSLQERSQRNELEEWLAAPDPSTNYHKALKQRHASTGTWLLESEVFIRWKESSHSFLWLHGIPGCGKTILSSTVIEYLITSFLAQPLLYFYFDFTDAGKQTLDNVLRSLISQLYHKRKETQKLLDSLFSSCDNGRRQPTCESLCKVFLQMIEEVKEVYIVLDALDECRTRKGPLSEGLLAWIWSLSNLKQRNVHLLVTSRPEHDIMSVLRQLAQSDEDIMPIQSDLIEDDIRSYVYTRVRTSDGLKRWKSRPDVLNEIQSVLMEKAQGM